MKISRKHNIKRHTLKKAQNCCFYCGKPLTLENMTMDHVHPVAKGGKAIRSNLVASCTTCNTLKAAMSLQQFIKYIKKIRWKYMMIVSDQIKALLNTRKKLENYNDIYCNLRNNGIFVEQE